MINPEEKEEFGTRVFQQFMDLFVIPEIKRREESGTLKQPFELWSAQIIFFPDGKNPEVRLNSEVKAIGKVKLRVPKAAGEPILASEIEGLEEVNISDDEDPDCAHATLVRLRDTWRIAFDFRYNKGLSKKHVARATEFYEAAIYSKQKHNWAAFIDNLFSANELLAKALLLALPDPKFREKSSHKAVHSKFNRFASLGNVQVEHREVFNKLSNLRYKARYLEGEIVISESEADDLLKSVESLLKFTKERL